MDEQFPPTTQQIPDSRVKLYFRGLGVLCFSAERSRAEIGYLDLEDHDTEISMIDADGRIIIPNQSMRGKNLTVTTPEKGIGAVFEDAADDRRNLSKMLDLSEIYPGAEFRDDGLKYQSKVFINDGVFFTDPTDDSYAKVIPVNMASGAAKPSLEIGRGLRAVIKSDTIYIRFGGRDYPVEANKSYIISIQSNCKQVAKGDFHHYFDILENAGDVRYDLEYEGGEDTWLTDFEQEEAERLEARLNKLVSFRSLLEDTDELKYIVDRLEYFRNAKCVPKPCLKVTFIDKPRSLR
jgi:hypothetical protein